MLTLKFAISSYDQGGTNYSKRSVEIWSAIIPPPFLQRPTVLHSVHI